MANTYRHISIHVVFTVEEYVDMLEKFKAMIYRHFTPIGIMEEAFGGKSLKRYSC